MPLVTVKDKFQVTIPATLRKQAAIREGDLLEATLTPEGILLRPKVLVDRDRVADKMEDLLARAPTAEDDRGKPEDEVLRESVEDVRASRAARRAMRR